jgi:import inner membrane translocase subunit TIM44
MGQGDLNTLRQRCSREVVERCQAERRALETQGIFLDNKILHISDAEVKDVKLLGNYPIIIVAVSIKILPLAFAYC